MDYGKLGLALAGAALIVMFIVLSLAGYLGERITPAGAVVTGAFALTLFFGIYYLADGFFSSADASRRLDKLSMTATGNMAANRRGLSAREEYADLYVRESGFIQLISGFTRRFLKIEGDRLAEIRLSLLSAGFISSRALSIYLAVKILAPLSALALGLIAGLLYFGAGNGVQVAATMGAFTLAGFAGPDFVLSRKGKERRGQLLIELPDVIDLMLIYTESGASFDQALQRSILRLKKRAPVACSELSILERELRMLPSRDEAFRNFLARSDIPLVRSMVNVLMQAEKYGTPIGEAFERLSAQTRKNRLLAAEQKAARIPILIMLPVFGFVLPAFMMVVLAPVVIKAMTIFGGTGAIK